MISCYRKKLIACDGLGHYTSVVDLPSYDSMFQSVYFSISTVILPMKTFLPIKQYSIKCNIVEHPLCRM